MNLTNKFINQVNAFDHLVICHHTQKTIELRNFSNRYSPIVLIATIMWTLKFPPKSKNYFHFHQCPYNFLLITWNYVITFKKITNNEVFLCKFTTRNIGINLYPLKSYRAVIKIFNKNNLIYHTYQTHEENSMYIYMY